MELMMMMMMCLSGVLFTLLRICFGGGFLIDEMI